MLCTKCGSIIEEGAWFCSKCGTHVEEPQAMPTQTPAQPQQYQQTAQTKKNGWQYFISAIKKYTVFNGRARRAEFWWFSIFNALILLVAIFIVEQTVYFLVPLSLFLPGLTVWIRRMHDVGKSGWYCLIPIYDIVLAATAGGTGPNKYGPDPKGA
jgi:uncharacterized membrane protein YhaH (DUF805 family)